jgi:hypothetical protein
MSEENKQEEGLEEPAEVDSANEDSDKFKKKKVQFTMPEDSDEEQQDDESDSDEEEDKPKKKKEIKEKVAKPSANKMEVNYAYVQAKVKKQYKSHKG